MDQDPYWYTIEKLTSALKTLATHPGDARERVAAAYESCFTLQEDDFPPEQVKHWRKLMREFDRFPPITGPNGKVYMGSAEVWTKKVRKQTGAKMAKLLWDLYWSVTNNEHE